MPTQSDTTVDSSVDLDGKDDEPTPVIVPDVIDTSTNADGSGFDSLDGSTLANT